MVARLDTSAEIRKELESIYWSVKQMAITNSHGKQCAEILKMLAAIVHQERLVEVDEQISELRAAIEGLKQSNTEELHYA